MRKVFPPPAENGQCTVVFLGCVHFFWSSLWIFGGVTLVWTLHIIWALRNEVDAESESAFTRLFELQTLGSFFALPSGTLTMC